MQSYVATKFGNLRNRYGSEFVSPCMDDIMVSSITFEEHVEDCRRRMDLINAARRLRGLPVRLG